MAKITITIEADHADEYHSVLRQLLNGTAAVQSAPSAAPAAPTSQPTQPVQPAIPAAIAMPQPGNDSDDDGPAPAGTAINPNELDSKGLPWDERIHSKNHGKNADHSWRSRRNISPELVTTVEAELRARVLGQQPAQPLAMPSPGVVPAAIPAAIAMPQPIAQALPQPITAPVAQTFPPHPYTSDPAVLPWAHRLAPNDGVTPAPTEPVMTFPELMQHVAKAMQSGLMKPEKLVEITTGRGLASISDLMQTPHLINATISEFIRHGVWAP